VTEWIDGHNLEERSGTLPLDRLLQLAIELCDILAFAHSMGIVHRDIKPSNVMISNTGRVKLLDFGIAKNAALGTTHLTTDSDVPIGTFSYMAPEQFASPSQAGPQSDLYSLGLTLYRLTTGALPTSPWLGPRTFGLVAQESFKAIDESVPAIQMLLDDVRVLPDLDWISDLDRVVRRAFVEEPADRFASAAEFKRALQHILALVQAGISV
ncbi:MAG: serine/threonine protein kinase, partial [Cyanobacteria bacterium REEB65]|nr:serine/threonine protein kinase [Cyanobacteria bacterium REEB65]